MNYEKTNKGIDTNLVDGIKGRLLVEPDHLRKIIEPYSALNESTGEVMKLKWGRLGHLRFKFQGNEEACWITVKGSLPSHIFGTNAQNFSLKDFRDGILELCGDLFIRPEQLQIHGLEIGKNLGNVVEMKRLNQNLLSYRHNRFSPLSNTPRNIGHIAHLSQHSVKIYDKGLQLGRESSNMRYELVVKRRQYLSGSRVITLEDLCIKEFQAHLFERLLHTLHHVEIAEPHLLHLFRPSEHRFIENWWNPTYTGNLYLTNKHEYSRQFKRYRRLVKRLKVKDGMKEQIRLRLIDS